MGTGDVGTWVSTRWGTTGLELGLGLGPPDLGPRCQWRTEKRHSRGSQNEGRVRRGITGAVLRHRMLPFLISVRFWKRWQKMERSQEGL